MKTLQDLKGSTVGTVHGRNSVLIATLSHSLRGLRSLIMFYLIWSGAWFQHILTNKHRDGFFMLGKVLRDRRFSPLGFWCPKNLMEGSRTCFHCAVVQVVPPPNQSYGFDLSAVLLTISGKVPAFSSWCLKHECQQSPNFVLPVRNRYLQIHSVQLSIRPMQRVPTRQVGTLSSEYWDSQRVRRDVFWTMLPFRSGPYFK